MNKLISIIIATYNAEKVLQRCLQSIITQKKTDYELIIIDGGSKDKTLDIIKKNESHISSWISEPDNGIYDAWNKGIAKASGNWIMFLGADDQLMPDAIDSYFNLLNRIDNKGKIDFISSKVQMIDSRSNPIRVKGWRFEWPLFLREMTVAHPGALHSRNLFEKYGNFNTNYNIVGDYEFLLRAGQSLNCVFMDKITVRMSEGGVSDSVRSLKEHFNAVIETAKYPKYKATTNFIIAYLKLKVKKLARILGLNIYLRKA